MNKPQYRSAGYLLAFVFCVSGISGCHANPPSDKSSGDMNTAMTAQQKAAVQAHKQQAEQDQSTK